MESGKAEKQPLQFNEWCPDELVLGYGQQPLTERKSFSADDWRRVSVSRFTTDGRFMYKLKEDYRRPELPWCLVWDPETKRQIVDDLKYSRFGISRDGHTVVGIEGDSLFVMKLKK